MEKNFDIWNQQKKSIDTADNSAVYFYEREIWWCYLGRNIGQEQNGKGEQFTRPILVLKKFTNNLCWVIPLSTKIKNGNFFFLLLAESNTFHTALLLQMKLMDTKRFIKKFDSISEIERRFINEKIIAFIR